nr:polyubiquitin [Tanacetum cinerariifolium]
MQFRALMALNESPLRPKVQHTRSTRMSKQILNKAKAPHRAYIMTKGKWLRYRIKKKNGPPLVVKLRGGLQIFVRTVTWKYIVMKADGSHTIADIKKYIQGSIGIPMDRQRLVLYGKRLDDDRCLADCDVREGSTLHLVILR